MPSRLQRLLSALALATALAAAGPADATVVVPLTRAQLVDRADLVVHATAIEQRSEWNADRSQIVTFTRLRVQRYLKGAGPQELVLRQLGGVVGDLEAHVEGDGHLGQGQEAVLFLRRGDGVVYLTAMAQSLYLVVRGAGAQPAVRRELHELTFAREVGGRTVLEPPAAEPPETLEHLAREVAARAAPGAP